MCTVTFVPKENGYLLGMNRDEQRSRATALPPGRHRALGREIVCPAESGGGTWIALNDAGVSFALINWYSIPSPPITDPITRGSIIPSLSGLATVAEIRQMLDRLTLDRVRPFRLVAVIPGERRVEQFDWNGSRLDPIRHDWRPRQWASSGHDERSAVRARVTVFEESLNRTSSTVEKNWLRRLHASHRPEKGPFSICMHRAEAVTVSYTEIEVGEMNLRLTYFPGPLCWSERDTSADPSGNPPREGRAGPGPSPRFIDLYLTMNRE